jgi:hypothetical protein
MEKQFKVELGFVQRVLPWIVAAGALVLYLLTLNHSATLGGLAKLAQVAGWDWRPALVTPLHFVLTYPIRWLPAGWQLVALNLLSAACASLALGLLARSVALLPHDRTREAARLLRSSRAAGPSQGYRLLRPPTRAGSPVSASSTILPFSPPRRALE